MSLLRSKSAPHTLSSLTESPHRRNISTRDLTARQSPTLWQGLTLFTPPLLSPLRGAGEDPFNLTGFFPSRPSSPPAEWDWLRSPSENDHAVEDGRSPTLHEVQEREIPVRPPKYTDDNMLQESLYDYAEEVIADEDKLGILSFSTDRLFSLFSLGRPSSFAPVDEDEDDDSPPLSPYASDDPVDLDALYAALCLRREVHDVADGAQIMDPRHLGLLSPDGLFLPGPPGAQLPAAEDWDWRSPLLHVVSTLAGRV